MKPGRIRHIDYPVLHHGGVGSPKLVHHVACVAAVSKVVQDEKSTVYFFFGHVAKVRQAFDVAGQNFELKGQDVICLLDGELVVVVAHADHFVHDSHQLGMAFALTGKRLVFAGIHSILHGKARAHVEQQSLASQIARLVGWRKRAALGKLFIRLNILLTQVPK